MTEEKVEKGKELLMKLGRLKTQKERWQNAVGISNLEVTGHNRETYCVGYSFINFEEIKLLVLAKIDRRIDEIQREFDNL